MYNKTLKLACSVSKCFEIALKELENDLKNIKIEYTADYNEADIIAFWDIDVAKKFAKTIPVEIEKGGFQIIEEIVLDKNIKYIISNDEVGAAYGLFDLAEKIDMNLDIQIFPTINNPKCEFRAIKFNLPWSSYREGEPIVLHRETLKDVSYWESFLNMMFKNRFSALTLWALHPYRYMVQSKKFPLANSFTDEEMVEWKKLWKAIFRMAKERGIETYIINWNIFVSENYRKNYEPQAVSDLEEHFSPHYCYYSEQVNEYLRECVVQMIDEYEDLTGFGSSHGERYAGMPIEKKQKWFEDVYFRAAKEAKRKVKFIHRAAFSKVGNISRESIENSGLETPVYVELKFNFSHGYTSTDLMYTHGEDVRLDTYWNPPPTKHKMVWMVRNEDFFTLRWAQSDFIREHINKNKTDYVAGYFIGSECLIPAYDYSHKKGSKHIDWQYIFQKTWLYYMIWGRLLYNPDTNDNVFVNAFSKKYTAENSLNLFNAYASACKMPMALGSFHSATTDFTLYSEGFVSATYKLGFDDGKSFISVDDLCNCKPISDKILSMNAYADKLFKNESISDEYTTPLQIAQNLISDADKAEKSLLRVKYEEDTPLECEVLDVKSWIALSRYFAIKLEACIAYSMYKRTNDQLYKENSISLLEKALEYWKEIVALTSSHYVPQPSVQLGGGQFSWERYLPEAKKDIEFVRNS